MQNYSDLKAYTGNDDYIFISYSHEDIKRVYPFINALQNEFNVWFDEGIHYGHEWEEEIINKLEGCSVFIFIVSKNSLESENCKDELFQARELRKNFINLILEENTELPKWFKLRYSRFQMCNYFSFSSPESVIEDLKRKSTWFDEVKKISEDINYTEADNTEITYTENNIHEPSDASEQNKLGESYYFGNGVPQSYDEAVKWFRKAAEQGDSDAQFNLGYCYYYGKGVFQDYEEAVKWYRKAAKQGNATAQFNLAVCYKNGDGILKSIVLAVKWYRKAAEQGYAAAQYVLGICYENGNGVNQDLKEAVKWYRKAAEQDNSNAQYKLGICYENGIGVYMYRDEAIKWYLKAAEQGDEDAKAALKRLGYSY